MNGTVTINIRIGGEEKKRLTEAAKAAGYTLSGFLRQCARTEAHRVLGYPKIVANGQTTARENSNEN